MQDPSSNLKKYTTQNPAKKLLIDNFKKTLLNVLEDCEPFEYVADLGCGEGFILDTIRAKFPKIKADGFDISQSALDIAKAKHPDFNFYQGDIRELPDPFKTNKYDLVLLTEVLEHIDDYKKILANIQSMNFKSLIISVPDEPLFSISNLIFGKNIKRLGKDPEHINFWDDKSLSELLNRYFIVKKITKPYPWLIAHCSINPSYPQKHMEHL